MSSDTDEAGRFRIDGLAAGRYLIYVRAPGFLNGPQATGQPAESIALADRQTSAQVVVRLTRGAVITGKLVDSLGEPVHDVAVMLRKWTYSSRTGERELGGGPGAQTDDRGVYRITSVPPGEYYVMTTVESLWGGLSSGHGLELPMVATRADIDAAKQGTNPAAAQLSPSSPTRVLSVPTYYPGTSRPSDATLLLVGAGQERAGIDFAVQYVPALSIRGRVVLPGGVTPLRMVVQPYSSAGFTGWGSLFSEMATDGFFTVRDVAPGDYVLGAQVFVGSAEAPERWVATVPVTLDRSDISDVVLVPSPGVIVSGRVEFADERPTPEQIKELRIALTAVVGHQEVNIGPPPAVVDASGRFAFAGVMPGRYLVELTAAPGSNASQLRWWLRAASIGGREAANAPVEVSSTNVSDAVAVVSHRSQSISGTVLDDAGEPVAARWVIVFPVDSSLWGPRSRWIDGVRPSAATGAFNTRALPAGDYFMTTTRDIEAGQWFDPFTLHRLAAGAVRVTVGEGEQKVRDFRVPKR
jgi:protocatechuate 3,4-dioxygenase beta subunit